MLAALMFHQHYHDEGVEVLNKIVTVDDTWIRFETEETKEQSKKWLHSHSPRTKMFKRTFSS